MPQKSNESEKVQRPNEVGDKVGTIADGKQSTLSGEDGDPTPPGQGDFGNDRVAGGGGENFPPISDAASLTTISIADGMLAHAEYELSHTATTLGRADEFEREKCEAEFEQAIADWRRAYTKDLIQRCGAQVCDVWLRGPTHGANALLWELVMQWHHRKRANLDEAFFMTHANGGGRWEIVDPVGSDEWMDGFVAMLRNPLVPRPFTLQVNALAFYYQAKFGNIKFFERVSEVFRKRERHNMRAAGGTKDLLLLYWIPGGLWRLTASQGCAWLSGIVTRIKNCGLTDPASEIVRGTLGKIEVKTFEKAKERLGL